MKVWSALAVKQLTKVGDMNTRDALRLVAYWASVLPNTDQTWRPVLSAVLRHAPERKRITSRLIATDRLLKIIFGETKTRPSVLPAVQVAVVDYIGDSAKKMDALKPDGPLITRPNRILDGIAVRLAEQLKRPAAKSKGANIGLIVLLLVLASESRRNR